MSSLTRVLFSTLLLVCLAAVGLGTWLVMQIRQDLAALSEKVAKLDRHAPAEAPATKASALPASSPSVASAAAAEVDALRRQVADLSARVRSLSPAPSPSTGATPDAPPQRVVPAPTGPTFDPDTKEAIKKLVHEAMEEGASSAMNVAFSGGPWGANDVDSLTKTLGLSETQKAEIAKLYETRDKEMAGLWTPSSDGQTMPDPKEFEKKMKDINERTDGQVKQLLTVEQSKKYDEMQASNGNVIIYQGGTKQAQPAEGK